MVNVLLITPLNVPFKDIKDEPSIKRKLAIKYPVGLLCIGACVKYRIPDVEVQVLDFNATAPVYFAEKQGKITSLEGMLSHGFNHLPVPDIVGISVLFESNYFDLDTLIGTISKWYPQAIIVAGGHLASACYKEFLEKFSGLDAICYGEGEEPFANLVRYLESKEAFEYISADPSWITNKKANDNDFVPWNTVISNLDLIPPYDLSMLEYPGDYAHTNDDLFGLGNDNPGKDIAMFATRGCPYHCIFCASQFVHGHRVRKYSVERIKRDILYYNKEYGITSFPFLDDHFLADKGMALELLNFIHSHNFTSRIFNLNYIHVDRDIIQALKRTGSDRILITIDGLNEGFLRKVVRKPADFGKAKEVIDICREEKITVICNIVVGFPGETYESIYAGMQDMVEMGANWYSILTATPLHGSELYDICKEKGYLPKGDDIFTIDYNHTVISTPEFSSEGIQRLAYEVNLHLNFVHNYDMAHGDFKTPLILFERVINKVEPNHAFAYYYAAICAKHLAREAGDQPWKFLEYRNRYYELIGEFPEWKKWSELFNLEEI